MAQATVTVTQIPGTPVIPSTLVCFKEPKDAVLSVNNPNAIFTYFWFDTPEGGYLHIRASP